jgi:predicted acyltransferase
MGVLPSQRLTALDAFRGLTIAGMILVNTPGSGKYVYAPLRHSSWIGCTPTDLVFPFFLFIVGVAMWYSFKKFDHKPTPQVWKKIFTRAALIFLIGLLLNAFPFYDMDISTLRIMGVLQRIAVAFLFGAILCMSVPKKYLHWVAAAILIGYWGLLAFFGGDDAYSLQNNIAVKVDVAIFGENHVYQGFGIPFDPEGLVSSIPAIATVIIGFLIGSYIDRSKLHRPALSTLVAVGIIGVGLGVVWGQSFPIIKALWTSSYVVYTVGLATILLALFLWLIDIKGVKKWAQPLVVFGLNPLFIYALSGIIITVMEIVKVGSGPGAISLRRAIFNELAAVFGEMNGSLGFAFLYVGLHWLIAWWMFRKKIFIKV